MSIVGTTALTELWAKIKDRINGIEIGGRNFLRGSAFNNITPSESVTVDNTYTKFRNNSVKLVCDNSKGTGTKYVGISSLQQSWVLDDVLGRTITISMWIYVENVGDLKGYEFRIVYTENGVTKWQNPDTRYPYYIPSAANLKQGWNYVYGSFTVSPDSTRADFNFTCYANAGQTSFAWFSSPKAEIGNKYSAWTPAPEDMAIKDHTHTYPNIVPIATKKYTKLCSANDAAGSRYFFGEVIPDNTTDLYAPWQVTYRLTVTTTTKECQGFYDVTMGANGTTITYYIENNFYSTAYRPIYYHTLIYPKDAASISHHPYIGLRVQSAYNVTTLTRNYTVEIMNVTNCTVNLANDLLPYSTYNSTYYTYGEYNATSQGLQEYGDADTYTMDQLSSTNVVINDSIRLPYFCLFGFDRNNKAVAISNYYEGYTSYTTNLRESNISQPRVYATVGFDYSKGLYYHTSGSSYTGNVTLSIRSYTSGFEFRYTDNCYDSADAVTAGLGITQYKPIYFRGYIIDGLFYLAPIEVTFNSKKYNKAWVQDIPQEKQYIDGHQIVYWFIGYPYSTSRYSINFCEQNDIFWWNNNRLERYTEATSADVAKSVAWDNVSGKPAFAPANAQKNVQSDWNATSGDALILNKPTIPTVNNAKLLIQKNGVDVQQFTANQSTDATANITVPTKVTDLENDANYASGTYTKPSGGIPKNDLASDVKTSLGKADTALQSFTETDPTVPSWAKAEHKPTYAASEIGGLSTVATSGSYDDLTNKPAFIGAKTASGYVGMTKPDGTDQDYIRTTTSGIIPASSNINNGVGTIGTSGWPFAGVYAKNIYENGWALSNKYLTKTAEILTTNPFAPNSMRGLYISKIDNAFYALDKRYTVVVEAFDSKGTSKGIVTSSVYSLFDGDYEGGLIINNGDTYKISLCFGENGSTQYFPGYPYGNIFVSFYYNAVPQSVSARAYCNYQSQGVGWHDLPVTDLSSSITNCTYKIRNDWYAVSTFEITIVGDTTNGSKKTQITEIEMHLDRPNSARTPFLSKYAAETLYYSLTAPSFIGSLTGNASTATSIATEAGVNTSINRLSTGSSDPTDSDYYIAQYAGGGTTTTTYHRRPHSALWNYIKGKISSVLGLTAASYNGKAATAGTADSANAIAWGNVTNKSTTLSGYGITDAKIANGVVTLGSNTITPISVSNKVANGANNTVVALPLHGEIPTKTMLPYFSNDIGFNRLRGGSMTIVKDGTDMTTNSYQDGLTNCKPDYTFSFSGTTNPTTSFVVTVVPWTQFTWGNYVYIDMGAYHCGHLLVEYKMVNYDTWVTAYDGIGYSGSLGNGFVVVQMSGNRVISGTQCGGITEIRFTCTGFTKANGSYSDTMFRMSQIGLINYSSQLLARNFLPLDGSSAMLGSLIPNTNNSVSLGSSSKKWANVYATTFHGALDGKATSAGTADTANNVAWANTNHPTFATVATSGSYTDLSNKPTIPTVNNATLTIQKNGTTVQTFTANQATNATANITVPTKVSELTNDSNFASGTYSKPSGGIPKTDLASAVQTSLGKADTALQEHQSLAGYATQAALDSAVANIVVIDTPYTYANDTYTFTVHVYKTGTEITNTIAAAKFSWVLNDSSGRSVKTATGVKTFTVSKSELHYVGSVVCTYDE